MTAAAQAPHQGQPGASKATVPGSSSTATSASGQPGGDTAWLFAFDFDHTIVDGNTDTHVVKALPAGQLPPGLKAAPGRWTQYMQEVLAHLHTQGVTAEAMQAVMQQLPYTPGMEQLLLQLQARGAAGERCSCIILSDSNSMFIDWILSSRDHGGIFSRIYTNTAVVSQQQGVLVTPHHSHTCKACPSNMCKREILQAHLAEASRPFGDNSSTQLPRPRVAYVGDGHNDLCPAQLLGPRDVLFVRAGYGLDKQLADPATRATVVARVCRWTSGTDIMQQLQALSV